MAKSRFNQFEVGTGLINIVNVYNIFITKKNIPFIIRNSYWLQIKISPCLLLLINALASIYRIYLHKYIYLHGVNRHF
jgi:hypothetical protein